MTTTVTVTMKKVKKQKTKNKYGILLALTPEEESVQLYHDTLRRTSEVK